MYEKSFIFQLPCSVIFLVRSVDYRARFAKGQNNFIEETTWTVTSSSSSAIQALEYTIITILSYILSSFYLCVVETNPGDVYNVFQTFTTLPHVCHAIRLCTLHCGVYDPACIQALSWL